MRLDLGGSLAAFFISTHFIHPLGTGTIDPIRGAKDQPGSAQFRCNVTLLDATLTRHLVSVASKGLTEMLSPLDATLTQNKGVGDVMVN